MWPSVSSNGKRLSAPKVCSASASRGPPMSEKFGVLGRVSANPKKVESKSKLNRGSWSSTCPGPALSGLLVPFWGLSLSQLLSSPQSRLSLPVSRDVRGMRPNSWDELSVLCCRSCSSLLSRYCRAVARRDLAMSEYCTAWASAWAKYSREAIEARQCFSIIRPKPPSRPIPSTSDEAKSHELRGGGGKLLGRNLGEGRLHDYRSTARHQASLDEALDRLHHQDGRINARVSQFRLATETGTRNGAPF